MLRLRRLATLATIVVLGIALAAPASAVEGKRSDSLWEEVVALWNRLESTLWSGAQGVATPRFKSVGAGAIQNGTLPSSANPQGGNSEVGLGVDPSGNS